MEPLQHQVVPEGSTGEESSQGNGLPGARLLMSLSRWLAVGVALVAGGHLLAWLGGTMARRGADAITMKTNTALCLLLLASALLLLEDRRVQSAARRVAGRSCAWAALVIGTLTLGENLFAWDLGIDQLLATESAGAMGMTVPNRMGSPASLSVILLGAALLLHGRRRDAGIRWEQGLALAAVVVGLLPTIGYLYRVEWLYGFARVSAIAWPTALSIIGLAVGLLCARPSEGVLNQVVAADAGGTVVRRLLLPVVLLPIALGGLEIAARHLGWVDPDMGTAILALVFVISLTALAWAAGRRGSQAAAALASDLAARRLAEHALLLSEEKFAKAFRGSTSAMVITRLRDGGFVDVNDRYLEITGFGREQVAGKTVADLNIWWRPDQRAEFVRRLRDSGQIRNSEFSFRRPDGSQWTGLVSAEVSEIGGEAVVISSIADITERKRQERRVEEVSRLFAVLSRVNETIVRTSDPMTLYQDVCRIIAEDGQRPLVWIGLVEGRSVVPVAVAGRASGYVQGLKVETDGELGRGPSGRCIREGRPVVNDDFDRNPSTLPWREAAHAHGLRASAAFPIRHQGTVIGALTLYDGEPGTFDGEQVRLLEALGADVSYALDKMWQERALQQSEQSLREADRRKDEFLAMLSHELRNPLAPIRSGIYILERATPGGEQAKRAQAVIDRQVGHLTRLVDDLLDVTRISRGKIRLQRESVDFAEVVRRVVEDHRSSFTEADVDLRASIPEVPIRIHADRTRVAQVVGNVLQNASKFTPAGGTVTVAVEADAPTGHAVVRVRDSGIGIAPDILPHLFEPFMQADRTLDRSRGGLGLGLALVKGLAELHEGEVHVSSDGPGTGAEFVVRLPLERASAPSPGPAPAAAPRPPRRVLIIEDNLDAAESLQAVLVLGGHTVRVAHDGRGGLELAREFAPDVVLCDIGLPGMDGFEVARAFRADPSLRATALVALSGYALPEDRQRAAEAGFDRHLAKPASPDAIERVLAEAEGHGAA
jgi:PAS domain S-box-containing protein